MAFCGEGFMGSGGGGGGRRTGCASSTRGLVVCALFLLVVLIKTLGSPRDNKAFRIKIKDYLICVTSKSEFYFARDTEIQYFKIYIKYVPWRPLSLKETILQPQTIWVQNIIRLNHDNCTFNKKMLKKCKRQQTATKNNSFILKIID